MKKLHSKFVVSSMGAALVASALTPAVSISAEENFRMFKRTILITKLFTSWQRPAL